MVLKKGRFIYCILEFHIEGDPFTQALLRGRVKSLGTRMTLLSSSPSPLKKNCDTW